MTSISPKKTGPRRRTPVQARAEATVAAILEATAQVLESHGYEGITTGRIAARAGVSVGSLYQYFPTKDAIITELVERHFARVCERLLAVLTAVGQASVEHATDAVAEAIVGLHRTHSRRHQAFHRLLMRRDELELADQVLVKVEAVVSEALASRMDVLRIDDPALASRILCRAVSGLVRTTLRREPEQFEDDAFQHALARLIHRYLV